MDQGYKEKPINSNNLQDSDKVKLDKRQEKEELSLTQRVKDVNKSFVFSESMLDEFLLSLWFTLVTGIVTDVANSVFE